MQKTASVARWRWSVHLALLCTYIVVIGASGIRRDVDAGPALSSSVRGLLVASSVELTKFALVFGAALLASRACADDLMLRWRRGFLLLPLGLGYSVALRLLVGIVAGGIAVVLILLGVVDADELGRLARAGAPDIGTVVSVDALGNDPAYFWLMVTFVSFVVAGLREELWRAGVLAGLAGLWPKRFGSRSGQFLGVALAALIFGFGHAGLGPIAAVAAGLVGLGLGAIQVFHRSIWPAVIAHGCFDAASFALLPWIASLK